MDPTVRNSREMIRVGSKSFSAAARLFDQERREGAYMLYAWCRHCDDVIDGQELGFAKARVEERTTQTALRHLVAETRRALSGAPMTDPVFAAFQRVVQRYEIPTQYPMELLDGFAMDVEGRRYVELEDTLDYCYHVAGVVGVMMALVMGVSRPQTLQRAADLGIAFQLTNIARDVMDDASVDRVYLPERWLNEEGVALDGVADPKNREQVFRVVERLLGEAERYYDSARLGIRSLEFRSAWAIATARRVYRDIGRLLLQRGPDAWESRNVVSKSRKLYFALRGGVRAASVVTVERRLPSSPRDPQLWSHFDCA